MHAGETSTPLGRYRLIASLGRGGMADVFLACTRGPGGFHKLLVVKLARFTGDPALAAMFLEEARIAAQLEHPNIVQTFEIAQAGSRHYIVMEYLDGANLAQLRARCHKIGDRARLQRLIDAQLHKAGSQSWDDVPTLADLPRITLTPSRPRSDAGEPSAVAALRRRRRFSIRFVAFVAALLAMACALALARMPPSKPRSAIPGSIEPATTLHLEVVEPPPKITAELRPDLTPAITPELVGSPPDAAAHAPAIARSPPAKQPPGRSRARSRVEAEPTTTPSAQRIDTDVSLAPTSKRSLDTNVLDESSSTSRPNIDRNPW